MGGCGREGAGGGGGGVAQRQTWAAATVSYYWGERGVLVSAGRLGKRNLGRRIFGANS